MYIEKHPLSLLRAVPKLISCQCNETKYFLLSFDWVWVCVSILCMYLCDTLVICRDVENIYLLHTHSNYVNILLWWFHRAHNIFAFYPCGERKRTRQGRFLRCSFSASGTCCAPHAAQISQNKRSGRERACGAMQQGFGLIHNMGWVFCCWPELVPVLDVNSSTAVYTIEST